MAVGVKRTVRPGIDRLLALLLAALAMGCQGPDPSGLGPSDPAAPGEPVSHLCSIDENQIYSGAARDGIPALTDPVMAVAGTAGAGYLTAGERVIGLAIEGQWFAIPHRILWWHEIVNLNLGDAQIAVTYCPLTGSSMAFDRSTIEGAEFGVSGLLFQNNLMMYDRRTNETLWPQMLRRGGCGPSKGSPLQMVPVVEMTWEGWTDLHPDTKVPAQDVENRQNFSLYRYPYGDYEQLHNEETLYPLPEIDSRRPPKERVLGIPSRSASGGGIAFPFDRLNALGSVGVVSWRGSGPSVVVFWDGPGQGAMAYYSVANGQEFSFEVDGGLIVDRETGSTWTIEGLAVDGLLAGEQLEVVAEAYVAFWFAWATFHPATQLWSG